VEPAIDFHRAGTAFWYGALSAASLPLGALIGLWLRPGNKWTSSLMSFGAGALLAALTLELVAKSLHKAGFAPLGLGCTVGALLFVFLNAALNTQGGFLRKISTTFAHLSKRKRKQAEALLEKLSRVALLRALPPEEVHALLPHLKETDFAPGLTIFKRGDEGDRMYLIEEGEVELVLGRKTQAKGFATLGPGEAFGEMALLTGDDRSATVRSKTALKAWSLEKEDFDEALSHCPGLRDAVEELTRTRRGELDKLAAEATDVAVQSWADIAKAHVTRESVAVSPADVHKAHSEAGGGAAFAIWLGIALDGIPESLVIGAVMIETGSVSLALVVGVFLANFPEALSSAVGMKRQGYSFSKIVWMWTSLMILTGVGAFIGNATFGGLSPTTFVVVEGIAAGAMLAMIAETMLPEAAEQGGPANGLMTVFGFLAAVFVGTLGSH
jgi:CRP-like cAMP-binding protein